MMSNNRADYGSASEWLSALRKDWLWLSQLQRLQAPSDSNISVSRDEIMQQIGKGDTFHLWNICQHKVEPVVEEIWDTAELSLVSLKVQTIAMLSMEWLEQHACSNHDVPEKLKSEEAKALMEDLVDEGLLDENWQPLKLSGTKRALVAKSVCEQLEINEVWQVFGQLWDEKPETLRSYLNKALDQKQSLKFQDRLKNILG